MEKQLAQKLIRETFQNPFNKDRYIYFVKNILNRIEESSFSHKGNLIFDDFADSIQMFERIGKYTDPDGKLIDILIVHLKKETSLDRARTKQRNFVAKYLKGSRGGVLKDAALVAFVSPTKEDWRFSLVKMEYKFNEKGKVEEEFTPARRYSFLVGVNENSHTAQSRLMPLLLNDEAVPTLKQLEEAFSVEKVTKEFFEKYRELFLRLKESLDDIVQKDKKVRADFDAKKVDTADFAKKLLGQIVFLYFLQKKGWFGVKRNEQWGDGSKRFLRELFEKKHGDYKNFFNDILEPLFYEALRIERPGDYYSRFDCRIPFLNGGLFDPLNDYDWWNTDILLPNELFSNNNKTKEGDIGDGILDIFDRYNFTVKEDEPLEKEVAIDPEMLGKVFENLLEVKDRKSKGTYYTPREIVHYMCQESLINYLATELEGKVSKEDIEKLIKYGETVVEHDSRVLNKGRETDRYSFKLPESVRDNANLIDEKLKNIRVCDPAVGSGAFLVGMMTEIVKTRCALTSYLNTQTGMSMPPHQGQGNTGIPACDPQTQTGMSMPPPQGQGNTGILACDPQTQTGMSVLPSPSQGISFDVHKTRRNLPHWTKEGSIYWVTFRLFDSLPQQKLDAWKAERDIWLKNHPAPWTEKEWEKYNEQFGDRLEEWLDAGYGSCFLERPEIRQCVYESLFRFDGERLRIHAAVIMPNHVHLLLEPMAGYSLSQLLKGIKGSSARNANKILGKTGTTFWMEESYDHIVRSEKEYWRFVRYIQNNPLKANLPKDKFWLYQGETGIPACDPQTQTGMSMPPPQGQGNTGIPACDPQTQTGMSVLLSRSPYSFKRHAIQNCLYGVDIDPSAVEIAKLRLWLSLIVDEEDRETIQPLPNLDYKIVQGNSLLGFPFKSQRIVSIENLKRQFFDETSPHKKALLRAQIDKEIQEALKASKQSLGYEVNFDFELFFSEVFHEKGGFDVVIANPPYDVVNNEHYRVIFADSIYGRANLYGLFLHKAVKELSKPSGHITFINPKTLLADKYFINLRKLLKKSGNFKTILKIADRHNIFENVLQAVIVHIFQRQASPNPQNPILMHEIGERSDIENIENRFAIQSNKVWLGERFDFAILVSDRKEIYSIFNKIIRETKSFRQMGIQFATGKIQWDLFKNQLIAAPVSDSVRLIWAANIQRYRFSNSEKRKGKEFVRGYLNIQPNIIDKTIITQRTTADEQERRIIATIFDPHKEGFTALSENHTNYLANCSEAFQVEFLLGLLNSKLFDAIFRHINSNTQVSANELNSLPIKEFSLTEQNAVVELVNKILAITNSGDYLENEEKQAQVHEYEKQIDQLVYKLYDLTDEEIAIVEGKK